MTQYLPPNLLALFAPRDPMPYMPPLDKLPWEKTKSNGYSGIASCLQEFEDPKDTPPPTRVETKDERKERKRKERAEQVAYKLEQDLALWDPASEHSTDPFKTLFIARVNYDTSESKLRREFEVYGPVKRIAVSYNKRTGKPRGFAFIEYEHERDMHSAYKHADGKKMDGRRVLVDVERGRTVKGWRPRRLGGGLGGTRKGGPDVNTRYSGRDDNMRERSRSREPMGRRPSRSRSRERNRRRRSRSPGRERPERRRRSRSRERGHNRREDAERKRPRRSRSRERHRSRSRDRKRRRSRSRDRRRRGEEEEERIRVKEEKGTYEGYGDDSLTAKQLAVQEQAQELKYKVPNGAEAGGDGEMPQDSKEGILESINEYGSAPPPPPQEPEAPQE